MPSVIEAAYLNLMDAIFARKRQPPPDRRILAASKLIAHRGEYDNTTVFENTLAAFERAAAAGVWGIELDVRWTRDWRPVVAHDPDLSRLYGKRRRIDQLTFPELRQLAPQIPSLAEVTARFGGRLHLMIEIKHLPRSNPHRQGATLQADLIGLTPVADYHLMALDPAVISPLSLFPATCMLAIAYHWPDRLSRWVLENGWGGLASHFSLLRQSLLRRHHDQGQSVGTAYPASANSLFRELNRGVDFIFSNHAARLQAQVQRLLNG